jgi:pimeloyl-ACP methyl ester carboxylesterase
MPALADPWHLFAPDFPGFGYSDTPDRTRFSYTFGGYADFLERFTTAMNVTRYALYLHDYGSQIGLRLAMKRPERVAALIIQNGDIYEDELGPRYEPLKAYWANPTPEGRGKLAEAVSEEGFRDEFLNDVREDLTKRSSPDLWKLLWPLMQTLQRHEIAIGLMEGRVITTALRRLMRRDSPALAVSARVSSSRNLSRRPSGVFKRFENLMKR